MNTIEPSVCGGDAALCQITLIACYMTVICRFASEAASMEQAAGRCGSGSTSHTASKPSTSQQQQQQATDIPEGLYDLLKGVTVAVLRDRPSDLYSFVADYFTKVRQAAGSISLTLSCRSLVENGFKTYQGRGNSTSHRSLNSDIRGPFFVTARTPVGYG